MMMFFIVSDEFKYRTYFLANMPISFLNISISSSSLTFFFIHPVIVDFQIAYSLLNSDRTFPEL